VPEAEMARAPYVAVATFCDKVLEGKDGVFSIIRIVDVVKVAVPTHLPADTKPAVELPLLIVLRSGDARGKASLRLNLRTPSGVVKWAAEPIPVAFTGDNENTTIQVQFRVGVEEFGLYWVEVLLDDRLLTKVPLTLREQRPATESPSSAQQSPPRDH
jgi:hypothetical protein